MKRAPRARQGWQWPAPDAPTCGAVAIDRATDATIACMLRRGHDEEHHWQEQHGDQLRSATWIGSGSVTYIGEPRER